LVLGRRRVPPPQVLSLHQALLRLRLQVLSLQQALRLRLQALQ
jgi:hypothetical protein